jgi:hypothetical protein
MRTLILTKVALSQLNDIKTGVNYLLPLIANNFNKQAFLSSVVLKKCQRACLTPMVIENC